MKLIDVSHTVESGMLTYKGLPAPIICDYLSREASRKLYGAGTEGAAPCATRSDRRTKTDANGAMIATHDLWMNLGGLHRIA